MNKHIKILMFLTTMMYFFTSTVAPVLASVSYSYDANGNMTGNGTYCYEYNEANQVKRVRNCSTNQIIAEYVYDYDGNRLVKKNYTNGSLQKTVYSPSDDFETVKLASNGATQNTSYYYANDQLIAKKDPWGNKLYYQNDHLGSASTMTNQSGELVESTTYDPWGEVKIGGTQSKFQYTGQEKDSETGLNYYNARYYDPHIRRFTQPDDILPNQYDPQQLNRYSYVSNNPLTNTDPTGHCVPCVVMLGGALTLAGLEVGGSIYGAVNSRNTSAIGRIQGAIVGAQNAVESPTGQIAFGAVTLGASVVEGGSVTNDSESIEIIPPKVVSNKTISGNLSQSFQQKTAQVKQVISNGNNIVRVGSGRVSIGPAPKYYEKLSSVQKVFSGIHIHIEPRKIGIDLNWFKKSFYKKW